MSGTQEERIRSRAAARQARLSGVTAEARLLMLQRGLTSPTDIQQESRKEGGGEIHGKGERVEEAERECDGGMSLVCGTRPLFSDVANDEGGKVGERERSGTDSGVLSPPPAVTRRVSQSDERRSTGNHTVARSMTSEEAKFIAELSSTVMVVQRLVHCGRFALSLFIPILAVWGDRYRGMRSAGVTVRSKGTPIHIIARIVNANCNLTTVIVVQLVMRLLSHLLSQLVKYRRHRYQRTSSASPSEAEGQEVDFDFSSFCSFVSSQFVECARSTQLTNYLQHFNMFMVLTHTAASISGDLCVAVLLFCLLRG